jgi:hypothetical protein
LRAARLIRPMQSGVCGDLGSCWGGVGGRFWGVWGGGLGEVFGGKGCRAWPLHSKIVLVSQDGAAAPLHAPGPVLLVGVRFPTCTNSNTGGGGGGGGLLRRNKAAAARRGAGG